MADLFGFNEAREFKDIPNQQKKAAEEKAILCLKLKRLTQTVPDCVKNGSINTVRKWRSQQQFALKVLSKKNVSRNDLQREITVLEQYK